MTRDVFQQQMQRLATNFGKMNYMPERLRSIWEEVKGWPDAWMTKTVQLFIDEHRFAPLLPEFRSAGASEREKQWQVEKEALRRDAKDFWAGTHHPEDIQSIAETIKRRIRHEISDQDWDRFVDSLKSIPRPKERLPYVDN